MELPKEIQEIIFTRFMGKMQPDEELEFERWLNKHSEHQKIYANYRSLWYAMRWGKKLNTIDKKQAWEKLIQKRQKRKRIRLLSITVATAASVAAIVVLSLGLYDFFTPTREPLPIVENKHIWKKAEIALVLSSGDTIGVKHANKSEIQKDGYLIHKDSIGISYLKHKKIELNEPIYHELITPKCGEYQLLLSDGTHVFLNAESKLRYPVNFRGDQREVYLEGEACFDVAKDTQRPFVVHTSRIEVKVLGTFFNISSYEKEENTKVTLVNGQVQVRVGEHQRKLQPNEQLCMNHHTTDFKVRSVIAENYTAWTKGMLRFDAMTLRQLMMKLERWYGVSYEFKNRDLECTRFTGGFQKYEDIHMIVKMLDNLGDVSFKIVNNKIIIDKK